jgi:hypothetical protein
MNAERRWRWAEMGIPESEDQNLIRPVVVRVSLIVRPDLDAEHAEETVAYVE